MKQLSLLDARLLVFAIVLANWLVSNLQGLRYFNAHFLQFHLHAFFDRDFVGCSLIGSCLLIVIIDKRLGVFSKNHRFGELPHLTGPNCELLL